MAVARPRRKKKSPIYFYESHGKNEDFFYLTNFYTSWFTLGEKSWKTVEHYFQAMKFSDETYRERIRLAKTPARAKELGQTRDFSLRADWKSVKEDVMKRALRAKFDQNKELRRKLLETHPNELIEDAPNDSYWGRGKHFHGENRLGTLLMELRDFYRNMTGSEE